MINVNHSITTNMKSANEERTYFEVNGDSLLRRAGISKTEFAEQMGVKKQNVNALFTTKNIFVLKKAAQVLGVPLDTLIADAEQPQVVDINGFVDIGGETYRVRGKEDVLRILNRVDELEKREEVSRMD